MISTELLRVKSAAIDNAREGITISDATLPDNPLVFVNKGFCLMTGYDQEEVIGKNCRFLQGSNRDQDSVRLIKQAVVEQRSVQQEIINYKKDGTRFWNRLSITPVLDGSGRLTHFVGIQEDVTAAKENELLERKIADQLLINEITLRAEEKQRRDIGSELHDNINQILAVSKLYLKRAFNEEENRLSMLEESMNMVSSAIEEIRKLSKSLVGPVKRESFRDALSDLIDSVQIGVNFKIALLINSSIEDSLTQGRKLMIYRIIQEQLNNIIKHAEATAVMIQVKREHNAIVLSIKDDGVGFDTARINQGIGLLNIKNRAAMEGATLSIISSVGDGCDMRINLSLIEKLDE